MALGYARETSGRHPLSPQIDALTDAGVDPARIYTDAADAAESTPSDPPRQGLTALLDYARPGDTTVVVGIDRLGRSAPEVLATARELSGRRIGLRSLREGLDTDDPAGAMIVGVLASLAELDAEIDERRRRSTGVSRTDSTSTVGRPRVLDDDQIAVAERMRAAGQPVPSIASALGVSRATLYRTLAERRSVR
ncbi:recombinase family protein [Gordonia sp. OPL2]|uniref:recombinase family protein n=1 Tax=Gordonia sp. OPL2 TaxID=2486274 RepID=UPI0016565B70|nr:recombinase family protein [Gordonia sp. OPL2]RPA20118.1 recombinase family protein [Gordonia sp. OPL2]